MRKMHAHSDADAYTQIAHTRFVHKFLDTFLWAALYRNFTLRNWNTRELEPPANSKYNFTLDNSNHVLSP